MTSIQKHDDDPTAARNGAGRRRRKSTVVAQRHKLRPGSLLLLAVGAFVFLFPFYYMFIGSLQTNPDTSMAGAFPQPGNITLQNYSNINSSINLFRGLINSGIFTGGVILCTVVFGLLVGYALAQLSFRGRGIVFGMMLLVQMIPFQLLLIPLYVLIVRDYGLGDTYLGMILPFAINSTAVFVFRQYFLQVPASLFEAARIDGASELRILWQVAVPLVRPALVTAILLTFIGPWNEFLWPFLVTKEQSMQPLAVSLANYISNIAATASNPYGAILAGACVLAAPAIILFIVFQRQFISTNLGSSTKG
ncbi:carbohydrate ABC transporter permease [Arthrobacter pigmenti]